MGEDYKRRNHYVWQYYLSAWEEHGAVICRRDGRILRTGTSVLGVEKDIYRLKNINNAEVVLIRELCFGEEVNPLLREFNIGWLPVFFGPFALRDLAKAMQVESPELTEALALVESNTEENLHTVIERESIPYIKALRAGKTNFLSSNEDLGKFLHFLCVQYFRTPKIRHDLDIALNDRPDVRADHVIGLLRHVFATNVAWGLLRRFDKTTVTLLKAQLDHEFITSDQPVINLHAVGKERFEPVEKLTLYYPVSPTVALVWDAETSEGSIEKREATAAEVGRFNRNLASLAHRLVFGRSQLVVENL